MCAIIWACSSFLDVAFDEGDISNINIFTEKKQFLCANPNNNLIDFDLTGDKSKACKINQQSFERVPRISAQKLHFILPYITSQSLGNGTEHQKIYIFNEWGIFLSRYVPVINSIGRFLYEKCILRNDHCVIVSNFSQILLLEFFGYHAS